MALSEVVAREWSHAEETSTAPGPAGGQRSMSTRKLIVAAFVVGMLILLAGALQFLQIARDQRQSGPGGPVPTASTSVSR